MLTKSEKAVMSAVFALCEKRGACFSSVETIKSKLSKKSRIEEKQIVGILDNLSKDEYIEIIKSESENLYCILLKTKGKAFRRSIINFRKELALRVIITVALAILSFLISTGVKNLIG